MLGECRRVFANAQNTANRVLKYNGLQAEALYHPPRLAARLAAAPPAYGDYVLSVGRIESVKRVDLLVSAMARVDKPIRLVVAGDGTQRANVERVAAEAGVADRVEFLGRGRRRAAARALPRHARRALSALRRGLRLRHARGVPRRASRSITATDSGGPNEFVVDGVNGFVRAPEPEAFADAINALARDRRRAASHGRRRLRAGADHHLGRRDREAGVVKKLIIQIPCLNEAQTLPATLADLPKSIPGIDAIEVLVIDDGSRDGTADVARACGVDHIVRLRRNKGLAAAFQAGIDAVPQGGRRLHRQHRRRQPVRRPATSPSCSRRCCAARPTSASAIATSRGCSHMSWRKRRLQRLGSWVVRQVSNTSVPDTTSGFRAYTREAALRMTIVSEFSYTLESIIQAGKKRMAIAHVPIAVNPRTRESRLFDSIFSYIKRSGATIVRIYAMYEPLKVFTYLGALDRRRGRPAVAALRLLRAALRRRSGTPTR